jgi:protein-tyrosine phosphatase
LTDHPIPDSYWVSPDHLLAGEYPSARRESQARKKLAGLLDAGVRSFVDLTDPDDDLEPYEAIVAALARERGHEVRYRRLTIPDMGVPTTEHMRGVLEHIDREIAAGRAVYVHCWGGVGRTGMVAGCWMVAREGRSAFDALGRIAELRRGTPDGFTRSPETAGQRGFIVRFACEMAGKPAMSLRDRCDALLKYAPHFDDPGSFATLVSPLMGDGSLVPYCELAPWATDFMQALEDAGWCSARDWESWEDQGQRYVDDPGLVAGADADVLARLLTLHVGLDRRNEGHLADMAERGHLKAILDRLKELRDQQPAPA